MNKKVRRRWFKIYGNKCPFCGISMRKNTTTKTNEYWDAITVEHLFVINNPLRYDNKFFPKKTCCCRRCNYDRGQIETNRIKKLLEFYKYPSRIPTHLLNVTQYNLFYNY